MDNDILLLIISGFGAGFILAYLIKGNIATRKIRAAKEEAVQILRDAKRQAQTLQKEAKLEAKDRLFKLKSEFEV